MPQEESVPLLFYSYKVTCVAAQEEKYRIFTTCDSSAWMTDLPCHSNFFNGVPTKAKDIESRFWNGFSKELLRNMQRFLPSLKARHNAIKRDPSHDMPSIPKKFFLHKTKRRISLGNCIIRYFLVCNMHPTEKAFFCNGITLTLREIRSTHDIYLMANA